MFTMPVRASRLQGVIKHQAACNSESAVFRFIAAVPCPGLLLVENYRVEIDSSVNGSANKITLK